MEFQKVKSAAKQVIPKGKPLSNAILDTMAKISAVVGATLGPGGQPVLIERFEYGLPSMITKDGVTVFRSIGFENSLSHCIMETARDCASRTAAEAGDGTTTATILGESIVRNIHDYCQRNPRLSPQKVVRHLERVFRDHIEPTIKNELSRSVDFHSEEGKRLLRAVATISANGDVDLADAVMKCFEITGDDGNVTIVEVNGPSRYDVEEIDGYAINAGWEYSCEAYYQPFLNDKANQQVRLEDCGFIVYHGEINDPFTLIPMLEFLSAEFNNKNTKCNKYVVVAHGFSDEVLGFLAINFAAQGSLKVVPMRSPMTPQLNGRFEFLHDIAAIAGATVFDPINKPLGMTAELTDVGPCTLTFEMGRTRGTVIGVADEDRLFVRVDEVKQQLANAISEFDGVLTRERLAKLSGGIAKLKVQGSSNAEIKEKRDRAEDAVCAVRGAIRSGVLPGGGWTLLKLCRTMPRDHIVDEILRVAFMEPVTRLMTNTGIEQFEEQQGILGPIIQGIVDGQPLVFDFQESVHVNPYEKGILDSTPAVLEAIRNALSIASQLGTMGGAVVFARDNELERREAREEQMYRRHVENG